MKNTNNTKKSNKLNKAYKYRIYPNAKQKELLAKTFGNVRLVYNHMLDEDIKSYKATGKSTHMSPKEYKKVYPFLKETDSLALCNAEINLKRAFVNFFEKRSSYPKFKKKGKNDSYTTNAQLNKSSGLYSIRVKDNSHILFPKLGLVKTKQDRVIGKDEIIKSATFSRVGDNFFVSILVEHDDTSKCSYSDYLEQVKKEITLNDCIGLDYSSPHFYVDSDGNSFDHNKFYRKAQKKLAREQRKLSKKVKGSNNYNKQKIKLQKCHTNVKNQRLDALHKESNRLTNKYRLICFEDIDLKVMSKRKGKLRLGKSTMDNGFGLFRQMCEYKAYRKGGYVVKVDKWYPSTKTCNHCKAKYDKITLDTKVWICPVCNSVNDRDPNAANNIKEEGYRVFLAM